MQDTQFEELPPSVDDFALDQGEEYVHATPTTPFHEGPKEVEKGTVKINCIRGINLSKKKMKKNYHQKLVNLKKKNYSSCCR